MNRSVLVDSDIVIDFLRGERQALVLLKNEAEALCFSAVTVAEIHAGVRNEKEEAEVDRLFSLFPVFAVTGDIAREAGKLVRRYRASHSVELPDALIAATSIVYGSVLFTLNVKHYPMLKNLKPPYRKKV
jgi:predicted nucleic acid-binding protein